MRRQQFSDINGGPDRQEGPQQRGRPSDVPHRRPHANKLVDDWLAAACRRRPVERGRQSELREPEVFGPERSRQRLGRRWIKPKPCERPTSSARATRQHFHGTTAGLQSARPGAFGVNLPGQMGVDPIMTASTGGAGQMQAIATQYQQQMTTANQTIAQQMPQMFQQPMQNVGQQFAPDLPAVRPAAAADRPAARQCRPGGAASGAGARRYGPGADQPDGTADRRDRDCSAISATRSCRCCPASAARAVAASAASSRCLPDCSTRAAWSASIRRPVTGRCPPACSATRCSHHNGLKGSEYPAILKRGERVLTANDNSRTQKAMNGMADRIENLQRANNQSPTAASARPVSARTSTSTPRTPTASGSRKAS